MISGYRRKVDETYAVLGYYVASSGNILPTFLDTVSVPSSGDKESHPWPLKMKPVGCSETSVTPEDETDRVFRNVGNILPLLAT